MKHRVLIPAAKAVIFWDDVPSGVGVDDVRVVSIDDPDRDRIGAKFENSSGAVMGDWLRDPRANPETLLGEFMASEYVSGCTPEFRRDIRINWLRALSQIEECEWARNELASERRDHFCDRMDTAEDVIRRVEAVGMAVELDDGKLRVKNGASNPQLVEEVRRNRHAIAEWLSIPPAEVSQRVVTELAWLREFAEEFAITAWRRLGKLTEQEALEFYNIVAVEYHDDNTPKVEPGLAALMAVLDARLQQHIDADRLAQERAQRDGCDPAEWAKAIELQRESMAKEGRWR